MSLDKLSDKYNTDFYINVDYQLKDMPDSLKEHCMELQ